MCSNQNDAKPEPSEQPENVSSAEPTQERSGYVHITDSTPRETALLAKCDYHPDASWSHGFGLAGGGFGSYKVCNECGRAFDKQVIEDGED